MERVEHILEIEYIIEKSNPPNLVVTVKGQVPSTGWGPTHLKRRIYVSPPSDGVWEYDLFSTPPIGPTDDCLSTVEARDKWDKYDAKAVKGLRAYGVGRGIKERSLNDRGKTA